MINALIFRTGISVEPTYVVDATGALVRRSASGLKTGLIPFSTEVVSSASDLQNPLAWTISVKDVEDRIAKSIALGANAAGLMEAYPDGKVPRVSIPFVMPAVCPDDAVTIESALDLLLTLPPEEAEPIVEYLKTCGIVRIPQIATFNQTIHEAVQAAMVLPPLVFLSDGWMSYIKVYRRSVVRSA